jgi:hypothetical protein
MRPVTEELYRALLNHRTMSAYKQPGDYVFCSSSDRPANPDQLREALQRVLRDKIGIHLVQTACICFATPPDRLSIVVPAA